MLTFLLSYCLLGILVFFFVAPLMGIDTTEETFEIYYTKGYHTYLWYQWKIMIKEFTGKEFHYGIQLILVWPLIFAFLIFGRKNLPHIFYKRRCVTQNSGPEGKTLIYFRSTDEVQFYDGYPQRIKWLEMVKHVKDSPTYKGSKIVEGKTLASWRKSFLIKLIHIKYANNSDYDTMCYLLLDDFRSDIPGRY